MWQLLVSFMLQNFYILFVLPMIVYMQKIRTSMHVAGEKFKEQRKISVLKIMAIRKTWVWNLTE